MGRKSSRGPRIMQCGIVDSVIRNSESELLNHAPLSSLSEQEFEPHALERDCCLHFYRHTSYLGFSRGVAAPLEQNDPLLGLDIPFNCHGYKICLLLSWRSCIAKVRDRGLVLEKDFFFCSSHRATFQVPSRSSQPDMSRTHNSSFKPSWRYMSFFPQNVLSTCETMSTGNVPIPG